MMSETIKSLKKNIDIIKKYLSGKKIYMTENEGESNILSDYFDHLLSWLVYIAESVLSYFEGKTDDVKVIDPPKVPSVKSDGILSKFMNLIKSLINMMKHGFQIIILLVFVISFFGIFIFISTNKNFELFLMRVSDIFYTSFKLLRNLLYKFLRGLITISPKVFIDESKTLINKYFDNLSMIIKDMEKSGLSRYHLIISGAVCMICITFIEFYINKRIMGV